MFNGTLGTENRIMFYSFFLSILQKFNKCEHLLKFQGFDFFMLSKPATKKKRSCDLLNPRRVSADYNLIFPAHPPNALVVTFLFH